jgi:hypothetical protein
MTSELIHIDAVGREVIGIPPNQDHPLHRLIGAIVSYAEHDFPNTTVILDKICGGTQNIQLFCNDSPSNSTRFCKLDIGILRCDQLRAMIEIEESNIGVVQLCGKAAASRLASHFIHRKHKYPRAARVSFMQFVGCSAGPNTQTPSKKGQLLYLQPLLQRLLDPLEPFTFQYDVFYGLAEDFSYWDAQTQIRDHLREALVD